MDLGLNIDLFSFIGYYLSDLIFLIDSSKPADQLQMLARCELIKEEVVLLAEADVRPELGER